MSKKPKTRKALPPIIVSDPKDKRLRAYNDSLNLYNKEKKVYTGETGLSYDELLKYPTSNNASPRYGYTHSGKPLYGYKKPVQPIVYQNPATPKATQNTTTNFEQRIQNPTNRISNTDGTTSTHKMMSWESDGKFFAAPTIVEINGKLKELSPKEAIDYAFKTKELKQFNTEKEAQRYAEGGYKENTPLAEPKKPTYTSPKKMYQGYRFTQQTGLRQGSYHPEEVEIAIANRKKK